ncbi:MAG: Crp/Fnr family transcriptional regulator [Ruminococcus sp.]|nr:Crp/Fnr family transcriptional regulator [Ruminococcus sp.]
MDIKTLKKNALFKGMTEGETDSCLSELRAVQKSYKKDSFILHAGDRTRRMGLVLLGSVTVESNDIWGSCTILSHIGKGQFFAETYALLPDEVMLVDVRANEDCRILFLDISGLSHYAAEWSSKLTRNLLMISAHKNLALSGRSFHTSPKSARGRILSYLNTVALQKGSNEFDIPFDRQQLANYLNLERTNMSKELGRMKKDGLIECRKNHFRLIKT